MNRIKLAALASVACLSASVAMAADLGVKAPPLYSGPVSGGLPAWTGWYMGGQIGYGIDTTDFDTTTTPNAGNISTTLGSAPKGFVGGGRLGYDVQLGSMVMGLVTDFNGANLTGGSTTSMNGGSGTASASIGWFGSLNGRIGFTSPDNHFLAYATGGLAYGGTKASLTAAGNGVNAPTAAGFVSNTSVGGDIGAGIEARLDRNWAFFLEGKYYLLGGQSFPVFLGGNPPIIVATSSQRFDFATIMTGVNYRF